jgi:hypothetical protein
LAEDGEVVCSLLGGRHHHDLFVFVSVQDPKGKGSSNPAFAKAAKRRDL